MNQQEEPKEEQTEDKLSQLLVSFSGPGMAEFGVQFRNVTPGQMVALGEWLQWKAHTIWAKLEMRQAQQQIATPDQRIILPGGDGRLQ